jgi:hypothetical protein
MPHQEARALNKFWETTARVGVRHPAKAKAPLWHTAAACPAARAAAAAAGALMSFALTPPTNRRRVSSAVFSSPRAKARACAMSCRGRSSSEASILNAPRTRSAQSAAHPATRRRSASLSVCGDLICLISWRRGDAVDARCRRCMCDRGSEILWLHCRRGSAGHQRLPGREQLSSDARYDVRISADAEKPRR